MKPILRFALATAALALFLPLSSCNTVSGVGKDLQILGKKMEGESASVQRAGSNY